MDFLKHRYLFIIFSLVIIIGGITYGLITGYEYDIDFKGGTKIEVDLKENFDNNEIASIVSNITGQNPLVQKLSSGDSTVSITSDVMSEEQSQKVVDALKERYPNMDEPSTRNVQPSYGKELLESALLAVVVAIIIILLYITIRFKVLGFTAAVTATLSLLHDALFIIAIYGIFKLPINTSFVAVILTIIGYSINDTIIVYDRIRENNRKVVKATDEKDIINQSISQTMRRTVYTSLTTIIVILIVYIFALINHQQVLIEFSLPLTIGILVGTYSSIFIASSLWYMLDGVVAKISSNKKDKKKGSKNKKK